MEDKSLSSSIPDAPRNGLPSLSSLKPGASPTTKSSAFRGPSPKTTRVLERHKGPHLRHPRASFCASAKSIKMLELLRLGQKVAQEDVHEHRRHEAWAGNGYRQDGGDHPHRGRIPPKMVGYPTAHPQDPTIPRRPPYA